MKMIVRTKENKSYIRLKIDKDFNPRGWKISKCHSSSHSESFKFWAMNIWSPKFCASGKKWIRRKRGYSILQCQTWTAKTHFDIIGIK